MDGINVINMLAGILEQKPVIRSIPSMGYTLSMFITVTLDSEEGEMSVQIVAENEVAEEICNNYAKGDVIYFLGEFAKFVNVYNGEYITTIGYKVLKIDYNGEIAKEINNKIIELLRADHL